MASDSKATRQMNAVIAKAKRAGAAEVALHTSNEYVAKYKFWISGEAASKSNSRKRRMVGTRLMFVKSDKAMAFTRSAQLQLRKQYGARPMLRGRLHVELEIFYATMRPDLDESIVLDAMQGIVYENDRQIVSRNCLRGWAKVPYVAATVTELGDVL